MCGGTMWNTDSYTDPYTDPYSHLGTVQEIKYPSTHKVYKNELDSDYYAIFSC